MLDSIELYTNLLIDYKEELDLEKLTILTLKDILEQTTAKNHIKGIISSAFDFLSTGKNIGLYSKYDELFEKAIIRKLQSILNFLEYTYNHYNSNNHKSSFLNTNESIGSHVECMVGKLLHGIGFDIMTFGNEKLKTETIAIHKLTHSYMNQMIRYYASKEYYKAISITNNLIDAMYKLIYNYQITSKYFQENREKLLPEILNAKKHRNKLILITTSPYKKVIKSYDLIINKLEDVLVKHSESFNFLYFIKVNNLVYVFLNQDETFYKEKYEKFLKDMENLSEELRSKYIELDQKSVFYAYKIEINNLIELKSEEIREIINIINEETKQKAREKGPPFVIVNVADRKHELLQKAREEISVKNIVLEKVANKDVDLFIQWIYDTDLNKRFFEILSRVKHGDEYIPAYKFINILERENKMIDLDIAVITNVIKNIDKIKALTNEFYMNMYPPSLADEEAVALLVELIELCNKKDIILNLELTEYAITTQKDVIKELSKNNFYLAFDDFGIGYTNYELLGEFVNSGIARTLKVDGYIVKRILESDVYASIVESITMFSKRINLRLIYEFVDNEDIIKILKNIAESIGFPHDRIFLQGFYLHKPNSLEEEYKALKIE